MSEKTDADLIVPDDTAEFISQGRSEDVSHLAAAGTRACCCPARPVIEVLVPSADDRHAEVDLLLCAHHYRASRAALARLHATVTYLGEYLP
jgi:hypothetical protein